MDIFSQLSAPINFLIKSDFNVESFEVEWQFSRENSHGDFSTPSPLKLSKMVNKLPMEVAEDMCNALKEEEIIEKCEVAAPGFVNVWLKPRVLLSSLNEAKKYCSPQKKRKDPPVIVEYSQPNIAKPLGIHHILSTVIGQAIANTYEHLGYECKKVNHLGDWGTQFGKLAVALDRWSNKSVKDSSIDELLALYVKFHEEAEKDESLNEKAREYFRKLEEGDKKIFEFWKDTVDVSMKAILKLYDRLNVTIEHQHGEAMYRDAMGPILEEGKEKGVFMEGKEGAVVVEFSEELNIPTAVVQKGDSATIYLTRDLAQIQYRTERWHPKGIYYVVDRAQQLHFQQLFETVKMLGWDLPHLEHLIFGRMKFADKSMSTRKGNILKLEEVLDEAVNRAEKIIKEHGDSIQSDNPKDLAEMMGVGSVVYGVLSQNRKMDMVFDWDKFLSFEGNSAPYIQYTHARACSVLRKADASEKITFPLNIDFLEENERNLIKTLLKFSNSLSDSCNAHMPHLLTNYLFSLCQDYNTFYNDLPIVKADEPLRSLRISLTALTASVIKTGANILTLRIPNRM